MVSGNNAKHKSNKQNSIYRPRRPTFEYPCLDPRNTDLIRAILSNGSIRLRSFGLYRRILFEEEPIVLLYISLGSTRLIFNLLFSLSHAFLLTIFSPLYPSPSLSLIEDNYLVVLYFILLFRIHIIYRRRETGTAKKIHCTSAISITTFH